MTSRGLAGGEQCRGRPAKYVFDIGQRIGSLTVVACGDAKGERRSGRWRVRCDCGREFVVYGSWLVFRAGIETEAAIARYAWYRCSKACPLPVPERPKAPVRARTQEQLAQIILRKIRAQARRRHRTLRVELTLEQVLALRVRDPYCWYCWVRLPEDVPCLDRLDCDVGYTRSNCIPCCSMCNDARGHLLSPFEYYAAMEYRRSTLEVGQGMWDGYESRFLRP
jgi:hypothetical protein